MSLPLDWGLVVSVSGIECACPEVCKSGFFFGTRMKALMGDAKRCTEIVFIWMIPKKSNYFAENDYCVDETETSFNFHVTLFSVRKKWRVSR